MTRGLIAWAVLAAMLAALGTALLWSARYRPDPEPPTRVPAPPAAKAAPADAPVPAPPVLSRVPSLIHAHELRELLDARLDIDLVFVGSPSYFEARRIPGARCVPYERLRDEFLGAEPDREIVLYCGCCAGASEGVSGAAARLLAELGLRNVRHLDGHFAAWQEAGYDVLGTDPAPSPSRTWSTARDSAALDALAEDTRVRQEEFRAAIAAERDPVRGRQLADELARFHREREREGLELKRRLAEEAGHAALVEDIERILRGR